MGRSYPDQELTKNYAFIIIRASVVCSGLSMREQIKDLYNGSQIEEAVVRQTVTFGCQFMQARPGLTLVKS